MCYYLLREGVSMSSIAGTKCKKCENVIFLLSLCNDGEMIVTVECPGCSRLKRVRLVDVLADELGPCDLCKNKFPDLWWESGIAVQYLQCYECKEVTPVSLEEAHDTLLNEGDGEEQEVPFEELPVSSTVH